MDTRKGSKDPHYPLLKSSQHHDHAYFDQLRSKMRWRLTVVYLTPLLVLSVLFYFEYSRNIHEGIDNHMRSIAENQRNTIDLFLQERVSNIRSEFRDEVLPVPYSANEMKAVLGDLRRESPAFVDLGLFRPDGELVAYAGPFPDLVGKNYAQETWFRKLQSQKSRHVISDVYLGFRDKPHFSIAVRRPGKDGLWTLRASVDPEKFGEFVSSSYLFKDAEAFIVNPEGIRQTFSTRKEVAADKSLMPERTPETEVTEVSVGGREYLRALAWLTENEWALVVRVPEAKAYASLHQARLMLAGILLLAVISILFVVVRSSKKLIGRLEAADSAKETLRLQLFNAAKLASVGEMAAGVAHEINNPLAIIYEEAAMLIDILDPQFGQTVDYDEFRERLGAIKEATMRGRSITKKLMAFARKHEPDPEETDINLMIDRVLDVKKTDFSVSDIKVVREFEEGLPLLMINRNQMDQVFLNLLNNAKDAIEDDGRITVRTKRDKDWVRIEVEDTGCGMSLEVLEKIFFPFFTTKVVGKGTGLGLSISYGIVEANGGRIEVESEEGKGTNFVILLPISNM